MSKQLPTLQRLIAALGLSALMALIGGLAPVAAQNVSGGGGSSVQLTLRDEGGAGDIVFLIGESLRRDVETGELLMSGGVQVRQEPSLLLLAEEIRVILRDPEGDTGAIDTVGQISRLELRGNVFAQNGLAKAQSAFVVLDLDAEQLRMPQGPSSFGLGDQSLTLKGAARVDLRRNLFQGEGGIVLSAGDIWLKMDRLQLRAPEGTGNQRPIEILAEGNIQASGPEFQFAAGRLETSADGQLFYFSGGVTFVGPAGSLNAGRVTLNPVTQDFSIDRSKDTPIRGLGFVNL